MYKIDNQLPRRVIIGWLLESISGEIRDGRGFMAFSECEGVKSIRRYLSRQEAAELAKKLLDMGYVAIGDLSDRMVLMLPPDNLPGARE